MQQPNIDWSAEYIGVELFFSDDIAVHIVHICAGHDRLSPNLPLGALYRECHLLRTLTNHHKAAVWPWNRALDQQQVALGVRLHYFELFDGHPVIAHAAGHTRAFQHSPWCSAWSNRAWSTQPIRLSMGALAATEAMSL